ncbi:MAG: hypothetical protein LBU34_02495 [Planctomycetaceae bacterium]|nr:hypothetical protein [Planctomycetaceae bacterium]
MDVTPPCCGGLGYVALSGLRKEDASGFKTCPQMTQIFINADDADFMINNSQGRQSLGENPSPSDCVGVSRQ